MFQIQISRTITIAGCPESGIAAIDFRRANGLPDGINNRVKLAISLTDESLVRHFAAAGFSDSDANVTWQYNWPTLSDFRPKEPEKKEWGNHDWNHRILAVPPETVVRLLESDPAAIRELCEIRAAQVAEQEATWESQKQAHLEEVAAEEQKKAELDRARILLADELEKGKKARANLSIVADFLSEVPADALRGTLKRITANAGAEAAESLKKKVEDASPITIFAEEEEDDEENDD